MIRKENSCKIKDKENMLQFSSVHIQKQHKKKTKRASIRRKKQQRGTNW